MLVSTPLGADKLLLVGFDGTEQISGLYSFCLDLIATNATKINFEKLLGEGMVVAMETVGENPESNEPSYRYFSGICCKFSQGNRDKEFTSYRAEIAPHYWLATRTMQSRMFQQMSVPDILKKIFKDMGMKVDYQLDGTFEKREYCVQYQETDFHFTSRLMEEEGICYFFKHAKDGHMMVVGNSNRVFPDVPGPSKMQWDVVEGAGHERREGRNVHEWVKHQEVRSGKFTMLDHSFELPGRSLRVSKSTLSSVAVGGVNQKLGVAGNERLEIYEYPGEYAKRFDGVPTGGGEQSAEVQKIFQENAKTAEIRMQAETLAGLRIEGSSNCRHFTSGHQFSLERHFDAEGKYYLLSVHHTAHGGNAYRSGIEEPFVYSNKFTCVPIALPFRPQRITPKPHVLGAQTALVVGPAGEEIFTDKYGRVKVQFPWDRASSADSDSSCWLRVGTSWAGKQWGAIQIPRIGHEVIVQFLEGDPDRPLIVGSVYNAGAMPPYKLPDNKTISTVKTRSTKDGAGFNEVRFDDKKGEEQIFIHGEKNLDLRVKHNRYEWIGSDHHLIVKKNQIEHVQNSRSETVDADHREKIGKDRHVKIIGKEAIEVGESHSFTVKGDVIEVFKKNHSEQTTGDVYLKADNIVIEAATNITIKVGGSSIAIEAGGIGIKTSGEIKVESAGPLKMESSATADLKSPATTVKGDGTLTLKGGMVMIN